MEWHYYRTFLFSKLLFRILCFGWIRNTYPSKVGIIQVTIDLQEFFMGIQVTKVNTDIIMNKIMSSCIVHYGCKLIRSKYLWNLEMWKNIKMRIKIKMVWVKDKFYLWSWKTKRNKWYHVRHPFLSLTGLDPTIFCQWWEVLEYKNFLRALNSRTWMW